jgi:nucleotide-binding universal stress UspA family protein
LTLERLPAGVDAMIKDVLVSLSLQATPDVAADYAVSLAATYRAHVVGIALVQDPVIPMGAMSSAPVELIEIQRQQNSRIAKDALGRFEAAAGRVGIASEARTVDVTAGSAASLLGHIARRFDLAVIGQAQREHGASQELMIEGVLFESGRPVIVVPYIHKDAFKVDRVLACWDGSRAAARAIGDAMPFLERAKAVDVVVVSEDHKQEEVAGASMNDHLARHGVAAKVQRIAKGDINIEDAILSYAADSGADFIVMGGYGHSRLREFMLGGVTRGMLGEMTVPVLMSH